MAQPTDRPPPRVRQRALAALALAALSLLAMLLIGNLRRAGVVAGVALTVAVIALVLAGSALSAAKRTGTRRPRGAVAGVVLGVIGLLFSGIALAGFLLFRTQIDQYSSCMNGNNTIAAQQACQTQLDHAMKARVTSLEGR